MRELSILLMLGNLAYAAFNVSQGHYGLATFCALTFFLLLLDELADRICDRIGGGK